MNWHHVNLPWSPPREAWEMPPRPMTDSLERTLFEGKNWEEAKIALSREYYSQKEANAVARFTGQAHEDSSVIFDRYEAKRLALEEQMLQIPAYVAWLADIERRHNLQNGEFFYTRARPGMIVVTASDKRYLIGDLDPLGACSRVGASGGPYIRHPLEGETILVFGMVDLPT